MSPNIDEVKQALYRRHSELRELHLENEDELRRMSELNEPDWTDKATETESVTVLARLSRGEQSELSEIEAALNRIDEGSYGHCEECGEPIGLRRLQALPHTRLCVGCAGGTR